jgi:predicted deacylase
MEVVRRIRSDVDPQQLKGTLLLVSVANPIAFLTQTRELPDGRDLNRFFPGRKIGSMASHIASHIWTKVVRRADWGIDLHTAAHGRTNLPHVRADLRVQAVRRLAYAFGSEIIFDMEGDKGTLRSAATRVGIPTIVFEAGEPLKFQRNLIQKGIDGVRNALTEIGMYSFPRTSPLFQIVVEDHRWIRAAKGGIMILNVQPGDIIEKGEDIAMNTKPFGTEVGRLQAPYTGLVVGCTTIPMVIPGSAVCHLVKLDHRAPTLKKLMRKQRLLFE